MSPLLSTILPWQLPASTAPLGLEQAETGLKRKRAGTAKYKQGREDGIQGRLTLHSRDGDGTTDSTCWVPRSGGKWYVQLVGDNGTPCFLQESLLPLASTSPPFRLLGEIPERPCPRLVKRALSVKDQAPLPLECRD